ncbi:carboxypeptidase regulatory-like domain-containing protein [Pseudonocardia sp. C8]|uniref:carboxypeptidase regulatory-like domain-containing protein n=1 Tax=Pseudonocardia sp. C8 TaxID=2762759 RepID=UPI001642ABDD|nr:carboxypeptidase regulatory-like domain-containing protein [Pseudonocardia sp. C8]MBC3189827.1 carboxypeptidase regulatory-like domain-containing protein [Pseudonocardia sp. C8]
MSTWALLGLLVVVLVAVGIAAFLRWGRNRDEKPASGDAPPRTVADLVERRARGEDDGRQRPAPDEAGDERAADRGAERGTSDDGDDRATGEAAGADRPVRDAESPGDGADDASGGADAAPERAAAGAAPGAGAAADAGAAGSADASTDAGAPTGADTAAAARPALGPTHSSAPDITPVPEGEDATDRIPETEPVTPRITPRVSAGPIGPPWSRGFKDGKPVEPVEPPTAPTRPVPRPSPVARPRPDEPADAETASRGPDSSAPDISTPSTGTERAPRPHPDRTTSPSTEDGPGDVAGSGGESSSAGSADSPATAARADESRTAGRAGDTADAGRADGADAGGSGGGAGSPDDAGDGGSGTSGGGAVAAVAGGAALLGGAAAFRASRGDREPSAAEPASGSTEARTGTDTRTAAGTDAAATPANSTAADAGQGTDVRTGGSAGRSEEDARSDDTVLAGPDRGPAPDEPAHEVEVEAISASHPRRAVTDSATDAAADFGRGAASSDTRSEGTEAATDRTDAGTDADAESATGAAAAVPRPAVPPRPDPRSPVDPDLVRRVTTVPAERPAGRGAATPDTEREFREARDRIAAQHAWPGGRVPEQQGAPDPDPARTGRSAMIGLVPGGAGSSEARESAEPAPRPAPRVLRSARPAGGAGTGSRGEAPAAAGAQTTTPETAPSTGPEASPTVTPTSTATPTAATPATGTPTAGAPAAATPATATPPPPGTGRTEDVALTVPRSGPEPESIVPGTPPQDIEVRVVGPDDHALAGTAVDVRDRAGAPAGSAVTGSDGVARVPVPGAGEFVVVARPDGYRPGVAACTVGSSAAHVTLRLRRASAVHGTVRTAGGRPAAGVAVVLEQDGEPVAEARSGTDGTYHLPDLDAGRYRLVAGSGTGVDVEVPACGDVEQDVTGA